MKTLSILTLIACLLVACEPCKHEKVYDNCTKYIVRYTEGKYETHDRLYDYTEKNGCIEAKLLDRCFKCGNTIGYRTKTYCGTFIIEEHYTCK